MLSTVINTAYRVVQNLSGWYWSTNTQQQLTNTYQTLAEVITVLWLVLSQCYTDYIGLNDLWLTLSLHRNCFVITATEGSTGWLDVWGMVRADVAYAMTWVDYRIRTVL